MATDQNDVLYGFFYNFTTDVYQVAKYTASGWTQSGGHISGLASRAYVFAKMRIAPDGTLYLLCGAYARNAMVWQLQPGGSWTMIGQFSTGSICNFGFTLELDPGGMPYVVYPAPGNATTTIQKYLGSSKWQAIGLPAYTRPFTPSLAFGTDGTLYCFYRNQDTKGSPHFYVSGYSFSTSTWQQVGSELNASVNVSLTPARIVAGKKANQLYIYWGDSRNNTINCQVYNGSGTDWQVVGNPPDLSSNPPNSSIGDWYLTGDGTGYYIFRGSSDNLIHAYKFNGATWQPLGTPFANNSNNVVSATISFAGNPTHLYIGWIGTDAATWHVSSCLIGKYSQNLRFPALETKTYGDADPAFVRATSNVPANPITYSIDHPDVANFTADSTHIHLLKAGSITITAHQAGDDTHNPASASQTLTISKAPLTITAADTIRAIGSPNPVFRAIFNGFVNHETTSVLTAQPIFSCAADAGSPVGSQWDIIPSGAVADNYSIRYVNGKLSVVATGAKVQTIRFGPLPAVTYGDADFDGAASSNAGLPVNYQSSNGQVATIVNGKLHIMGAGTSVITASQPGDQTYAPATNVQQTLTVSKAALSITADDKLKNNGDPNPALTATYTGFVNHETATALLTPAALSTTATAASAPGIYPITVSGATSNNYEIRFVGGKLIIKGTQVITWAPLSTLTYGDAAFDPGAVSSAGATPVYTTNNPSIIAIQNGKAVIKGAGTVTITATFAATGGWDLTTSALNVTVQKKQLVIRADDKSRPYGEVNPVFTVNYKGFVYEDNAISGALTSQPVVTTTATITSPAGSYPISASGAASDNYSIVYVDGKLTVNPVTRTITFAPLPVKTYGNGDFDPGATSNTNETPVYSSSNTAVATIVNGQVHITGAGMSTITAGYPGGGSYTGATTASQALTVNKAPLTITAENKVMAEGASQVRYTVTYQGLVNGDTWAVFNPSPVISSTATSQSPIGTYPITVSGAGSSNYTISYVNGTLTIVPAADGRDNSLLAWTSSRSTMELRIYVAESQKATINLFSFSGQRLLNMEKQLSLGLNQQQLNIGNLAAGVYILQVNSAKFNLKQKVLIR
jgi:hypothetical protein